MNPREEEDKCQFRGNQDVTRILGALKDGLGERTGRTPTRSEITVYTNSITNCFPYCRVK